VIQTLVELGPVKLLADEQTRLREAADTLFFGEDIDAPAAVAAMQDSRAVLEHLVSCGRWTDERAGRLADDLAACGPLIPVS
jgi:hypothetical protein